jgi:prevent-host-death family protein
MPHYSVAESRDKLSKLIDKALAGEEVVITRHGKPKVALAVVAGDSEAGKSKLGLKERREWSARFSALRATLPSGVETFLETKRKEQDEWEGRFDR